MRLTFDIDGVVADTDSAMLGLLHDAERRGDQGSDQRIRNYYLSRQVRFRPTDFTAPGDEWWLITGRVPMARDWTRAWVAQHFGDKVMREKLVFVSDASIADLFATGDYDAASRALALAKARSLTVIRSEVHFDNNAVIVKFLRERHGFVAVQVGGFAEVAGWN